MGYMLSAIKVICITVLNASLLVTVFFQIFKKKKSDTYGLTVKQDI